MRVRLCSNCRQPGHYRSGCHNAAYVEPLREGQKAHKRSCGATCALLHRPDLPLYPLLSSAFALHVT